MPIDPYKNALKEIRDRSEDPGLASKGEDQVMDEFGNWNYENKKAFEQMKKDFKEDQERRKRESGVKK